MGPFRWEGCHHQNHPGRDATGLERARCLTPSPMARVGFLVLIQAQKHTAGILDLQMSPVPDTCAYKCHEEQAWASLKTLGAW